MTRLSFIPAQFIKVATAHRADLSHYVVGGIHLAPDSSSGLVRAWKVNLPDRTDGGEIPIPNAQAQKDDSVSFLILPSGDLLVTYCEAAPGGGGASSQPESVIVAGVFPAAPDTPATGGGASALIAPAAGELWALAKAPFVGDIALPLAPLGVPPCSSVMVRLVVTGAPGRLARLNNGAIEAVCQVAGVRSTIQGEIALDDALTLELSVAQELTECHVQIIGWRY